MRWVRDPVAAGAAGSVGALNGLWVVALDPRPDDGVKLDSGVLAVLVPETTTAGGRPVPSAS